MRDKRFHCRTQYFKGTFTVQYSHHRFLPNWRTIMFWEDPGTNFTHEGWQPRTFQNLKQAEKFAFKFQNMEDLEAYYKEYELKANNLYLNKIK